MEHLSATLRTLRAKKHYTQHRVADEIGVTQSHYAKIEKGEKDLSFRSLVRLASLYKMNIHMLVEALLLGLDRASVIHVKDRAEPDFYKQLATHYEKKATLYLRRYIELCQRHGLECIMSGFQENEEPAELK